MNTLLSIFSLFIICVGSENFTTELDYPDKEALRYGFQKTADCKSFEKSFVCVRKCLDLGYDVAVADKNCKCTCYTKADKAKYSSYAPGGEKWKSGAPTTKLPQWAETTKNKPKPGEENASGFDDEKSENDKSKEFENESGGNGTISPDDMGSGNDTTNDNDVTGAGEVTTEEPAA